jgi:hypothetical protein
MGYAPPALLHAWRSCATIAEHHSRTPAAQPIVHLTATGCWQCICDTWCDTFDGFRLVERVVQAGRDSPPAPSLIEQLWSSRSADCAPVPSSSVVTDFASAEEVERFLAAMRAVWQSPAAAPALAGTPQARIVEPVESKEY